MFNRTLEIDAEVVGGVAKNFADFRRDTCAIGVDVVDGVKLL